MNRDQSIKQKQKIPLIDLNREEDVEESDDEETLSTDSTVSDSDEGFLGEDDLEPQQQKTYQGITSVNSNALIPGTDDPFNWHMQKYFDGVLEKNKRLDRDVLEQYFSTLMDKINQLAADGRFIEIENLIRDKFLKRLRQHAIRKMAFQISEGTSHDESSEGYKTLSVTSGEYVKNLAHYYEYTKDIHFSHTLSCVFSGAERVSTHALTTAVDSCFLYRIEDPLWQAHISYTLLSNLQTTIFQEGQDSFLPEMYSGKISSHVLILDEFFNDRKHKAISNVLNKHNLYKKIEQLKQIESIFVNKMLSTVSSELQNHEGEKPGFYLSLLCALYSEDSKSTTASENRLKIKECLTSFKLVESWVEFEKSEIFKLRAELNAEIKNILKEYQDQFTDYHQQIDDYRLQFYAEYLANRERKDVENIKFPLLYSGIKEFYTETVPDGYKLTTPLCYFPNSQTALTNPIKLVEFCGGSEQLAWLSHQYGEYELELWEEVLASVDFDELGLDHDIAAYILHTTFLYHDYLPEEILSNGFTPKIFERFIKELKDQKEPANDNIFALETLDEFVKKIQNNFVQLLQDKKIKELQQLFNDAYQRKDWLEIQKLWPVFTKFQRLLVSTEKAREISEKYPQARPPVKGRDHDFSSDKKQIPQSYSQFLEKLWSYYGEQTKEHYTRLFLSPNTHTLAYSSSRNPQKTATLDIKNILGELERVGRAIRDALYNTETSGNNKANIFTPVLCFVVTDRPHQKQGNHRRLFIPVTLDLLTKDHAYLLSNDFEDGVFKIADDNQKKDYLKEKSIAACETGFAMQKIKIPADLKDQNYRKFDHSESVLMEMLRQPQLVQKLVPLLRNALEHHLGHSLKEGAYKIYAIAKLDYSSNSICNYCTPSLISLQGSHNDGFLYHLSQALNAENSGFKTAGYDQQTHKQRPEKLPLLTIITADAPWAEQAYHLLDSSKLENCAQPPKVYQHMENPKGLIHLPKNTFDLRTLGSDKNNAPYPYHVSFIEFVDAKFREHGSVSDKNPRFVYAGNSFMSGSKREKFGNNAKLVDEKVNEIMQKKEEERKKADVQWNEQIKLNR